MYVLLNTICKYMTGPRQSLQCERRPTRLLWLSWKGSISARTCLFVAIICHLYGCFLKWWYLQNTPKWSFLVGKPMVVGYHYFRKHPYRALLLQKAWWSSKKIHQPDWIFTVVSFRGRIFTACFFFIFSGLPPWKLTCPLKKDYFSREYIWTNHWFSGDMSLVFRDVLYI